MRCRRPFACFGFTLIELVIVVGVIALLVGILLPTVNRAREAGRVVVCTDNLRQIDTAYKTWATRRLPSAGSLKLPDAFGWIATVQSVTADDRILYCPDGDQSRPTATAFAKPSVTQSKPYSGNGHPSPVWTPDPDLQPNADSYTITITYQNTHPGQAVLVLSLIHI